MNLAGGLITLAERGWLPDSLVRIGIRRLLRRRLASESVGGPEAQATRQARLIREMSAGPIAVETDAANDQHYEIPADFFDIVLGRHLKYSSALWSPGTAFLDDAEAAMLAVTCERAGLVDGQRILELGCGWGSLTLWMARNYPSSRITAVSNSASQRRWIMERARADGLTNVDVLTADVNTLELSRRFDRVVSVEMFEHVRNHARLMQGIAQWLTPGGVLFIHVFCHRTLMYPFVEQDHGDWMSRHFFTGGLMPSADTLLHYQQDLHLDRRWLLDGRHYARTAGAWLERMDADPEAVRAALGPVYGAETSVWMQRWRMFFMACEELFAFRDGSEWMVAHYRFRKP